MVHACAAGWTISGVRECLPTKGRRFRFPSEDFMQHYRGLLHILLKSCALIFEEISGVNSYNSLFNVCRYAWQQLP